MGNSLFGAPSLGVMETALSASSLRHKVISNNMANANTPMFKKSDVAFEDILRRELESNNLPLARTNDKHFPMQPFGIKPHVEMQKSYSMRTDGNNVDIDAEMAALAKNTIYYDAMAQQVSRYFVGLKSAVNEGRR